MEALDRIISRLWLANRFGGNMTPAPQETQKGRFVTREQVGEAIEKLMPGVYEVIAYDTCDRIIGDWHSNQIVDDLCRSLGIE
jgi:hypothetical protein